MVSRGWYHLECRGCREDPPLSAFSAFQDFDESLAATTSPALFVPPEEQAAWQISLHPPEHSASHRSPES